MKKLARHLPFLALALVFLAAPSLAQTPQVTQLPLTRGPAGKPSGSASASASGSGSGSVASSAVPAPTVPASAGGGSVTKADDTHTVQHDTRTGNFLAFAQSLNALCKPAGDKIVTAKLAAKRADLEKTADAVCRDLCTDSAKVINACAFTDSVLANAAVASDWPSAQQLMARTNERLVEPAPHDIAAARKEPNSPYVNAVIASDTDKRQSGGVGIDLAGNATEVATKAIQGLAKLIVDRAKREAIAYFLDEMSTNICADTEGTDTEKAVRHELKTYWFPALCALAADHSLAKYGSGTAVLDTLRSALASDLQGWPGAAGSVGIGGIFAAETKQDLFACDPKKEECARLARVRAHAAVETTRLLQRGDPAQTLGNLADEVAVENSLAKATTGANTQSVYSPTLGVAMCAASVPVVAESEKAAFEKSLGNEAKNERDVAMAIALTSVARAPSCWSLFGKGATPSTCGAFTNLGKDQAGNDVPSDCAPKTVLAEPNPKNLEHLSVIVTLGSNVRDSSADIGSSWSALKTALPKVKTAFDALTKSKDALPDMAKPTLAVGKDPTESSNLQAGAVAYVETMARVSTLPALKQFLNASAEVVDDGLRLSDAVLRAAAKAPTAWVGIGGTSTDQLTKATAILERIQASIRAAIAAANGEWANLLTQALSIIRPVTTDAAKVAADAKTSSTVPQLLDTTARYGSVITAIVNAKTSDDVAAIIDDAARPIGGWRDKGVDGRRTLSITAHPGLFSAFEWRFGTYGTRYEKGDKLYGQAPTLALPVGLELAWGFSCITPSLFIPVLDPAAFLDYDASKDGKLPAARLLTVLSPGVGFRFSFGKTPFGIMPTFVYRPGFRATESSVAHGGADAVQLGLQLSIDTTLFDLHTWSSQ